jgi:hypothetical protein
LGAGVYEGFKSLVACLWSLVKEIDNHGFHGFKIMIEGERHETNHISEKEKIHKKEDKSSVDSHEVKRRTNQGTCPVCGNTVNLMEQQALTKERVKVPWFCTYENILSDIEEGKGEDPHSDRKIIHWACNDCISTGKALLADSREQTFCDFTRIWPILTKNGNATNAINALFTIKRNSSIGMKF